MGERLTRSLRSSKKIFGLVAYDVTDDKRRNRLHKSLKGYGYPVQLSVFEYLLFESELEEMTKAIKRIVDMKEDSVRIYIFCASCEKKVNILGIGKKTEREFAVVA